MEQPTETTEQQAKASEVINASSVVSEESELISKITVEVTPGDEDEITDITKPSDILEPSDLSPKICVILSEFNEGSNQDSTEENKTKDASEEPETKDQKTMSREMKSLIDSAKESKIINEFTQIKSKIRKSRKDVDISAATGNVNTSLDVDKELGSRRSSDNSLVSSSSDTSDKTGRRSMRSLNPDFVHKQRKFLNSLSGKPTKDEGSASESESENGHRSASQIRAKSNVEDVEMEPAKKKSDKYCWRCHWIIEASPTGLGPRHCSVCPRSYHPKCLSSKAGNPENPDWVCPECMTVLNAEAAETRSPSMQKTSLSTLCTLLNYALARMKLVNGVEEFLQQVNVAQCPDYYEHVVHPMDLGKVQQNIVDGLYGSTEAFLADTLWILHNCLVYNSPVRSRLTFAARSLVRECRKEIGEIEACPECYAAAHARKPTWFTDVCSTPHILLWAKLKGFPFWPAKGMTVNEMGMVDVRFFGDHDRAWVPAKYCHLYSQKDPNNSKAQRNDILESIKEAEQHIKNIIRKFGSFVHANPRTQFEPAHMGEQLRAMIPGYKGVLPAPRLLKESSSNTSSPISKLKRPRSSSKGSKDSRDGYISDDDDADTTHDEDSISVPGSIREKSSEKDFISTGSPSHKRRKTDQEIKSNYITSIKKRKRNSSSIEKSEDRDLPDKDEKVERMTIDKESSKEKSKELDKKRKISIENASKLQETENERASPESSHVEPQSNNKESDTLEIKESDYNKKLEQKKSEDKITDEIKKSKQNKSDESKTDDTEKVEQNKCENKNEIKIIEQKKPDNKTNESKIEKKSPEKHLKTNFKTVKSPPEINRTSKPGEIIKCSSLKTNEKIVIDKQMSKSTDSNFGSRDNLPTITSVRSLAGDEATSTFVSRRSSEKKDSPPKKSTELKIETSQNSKISTPANFSNKSKESNSNSQSKNNDQRTTKASAQTSKQINTNSDMFIDLEIKTEPIEYDEADKSLEKNDLLESLNLRPTGSVDPATSKSSHLRWIRRTLPVKSTTPARARKTFPQPARKSPISNDSRVDLNGQNTMVYIPIQPPPTSAPPTRMTTVKINRPPVVNNSSPQRPTVTSNSIGNNTITSTATTSTPPATTPLLTVATNLMPASPIPTSIVLPISVSPSATSLPVTASPSSSLPLPISVSHSPLTLPVSTNNSSVTTSTACTVMQSVPMLSSFNGQWTLCLPTTVNVEGPTTVPMVNGLSDSLLTSTAENTQPHPIITAVPTASLINTPAREPPPLQVRPGNPLDPDTPIGPLPIPSEAGPCWAQINQSAVKLADYFRSLLTDSLQVLDDPLASVGSLRLQMEALAWKHKQELAELKHNTDIQLIEMRNIIEREKSNAVAEARRAAEIELNAAVAQAKSKTWCANCRQEAQFYCCWNTSYCDYPCQQAHWSKHMSVCTQTRNNEVPVTEETTMLKTVGGKTVVARTLNTNTSSVVRTAAPNIMMKEQTGAGSYKRPQYNQPAYIINKQLMQSEETPSKITPGGYLIVGGSNTGRPVVTHGSTQNL